MYCLQLHILALFTVLVLPHTAWIRCSKNDLTFTKISGFLQFKGHHCVSIGILNFKERCTVCLKRHPVASPIMHDNSTYQSVQQRADSASTLKCCTRASVSAAGRSVTISCFGRRSTDLDDWTCRCCQRLTLVNVPDPTLDKSYINNSSINLIPIKNELSKTLGYVTISNQNQIYSYYFFERGLFSCSQFIARRIG